MSTTTTMTQTPSPNQPISSIVLPSAPVSTPPPKSILIIGAGVFGISTAHALLSNPTYQHTHITVVDAYATPPPPSSDPDESQQGRPQSSYQQKDSLSSSQQGNSLSSPGSLRSPQEITASLDTSRIIRPDYAHPLYAALADQATCLFREGWAEGDHSLPSLSFCGEKTYTQPGLVLISTAGDGSRGKKFVERAWENTLLLARAKQSRDDGQEENMPVALPTRDDIEKILGLKDIVGSSQLPAETTGYINPQAGWANASAGIEAIKARVIALGKSREKAAGQAAFSYLSSTKVESLLLSPSKQEVTGVTLSSSGQQIAAEITILATGAWSSTLLPSLLSPRLRATGQILAYIPLHNTEEIQQYAGKPTVLDMESGLFAIFPPANYIAECRSQGHIKIARHGWGYSHIESITDPLTGKQVECSLPPHNTERESFFHLPLEGQQTCREFARMVVVDPCIAEREFALERVCWYTDTPTADFLVDFVPGLKGVMVASGGSGHGYKFLPVIGGKVVERLEGSLDPGLAELWRWRSDGECKLGWMGEGDGSRGGRKGMSWEEELARVR